MEKDVEKCAHDVDSDWASGESFFLGAFLPFFSCLANCSVQALSVREHRISSPMHPTKHHRSPLRAIRPFRRLLTFLLHPYSAPDRNVRRAFEYCSFSEIPSAATSYGAALRPTSSALCHPTAGPPPWAPSTPSLPHRQNRLQNYQFMVVSRDLFS